MGKKLVNSTYKAAKTPIRTDAATYRAALYACVNQPIQANLNGVFREAIKSRFPEEFARAEAEILAEAAEAETEAQAGAEAQTGAEAQAAE